MPTPPTTGDDTAGDDTTTVAELRQLIADFVDQRDWQQYHSPKNISMALAVEAAELMEHFQWMDQQASRLIPADEQKLQAVGEEIADVIGYAMAISNELGIDISATMRAKMQKNREKYPVEECRGDKFRQRLSTNE